LLGAGTFDRELFDLATSQIAEVRPTIAEQSEEHACKEISNNRQEMFQASLILWQRLATMYYLVPEPDQLQYLCLQIVDRDSMIGQERLDAYFELCSVFGYVLRLIPFFSSGALKKKK
jgi:hypothetical protein